MSDILPKYTTPLALPSDGRHHFFLSFRGPDRVKALELRELLLEAFYSQAITRWEEVAFIDWLGIGSGHFFTEMYTAASKARVFVALVYGSNLDDPDSSYFTSQYTKKEIQTRSNNDANVVIIGPNVDEKGVENYWKNIIGRDAIFLRAEPASELIEQLLDLHHTAKPKTLLPTNPIATRKKALPIVNVALYPTESVRWARAVWAGIEDIGNTGFLDIRVSSNWQDADIIFIPTWRFNMNYFGSIVDLSEQGKTIVPFALRDLEQPWTRFQGCQGVGEKEVNVNLVIYYVQKTLTERHLKAFPAWNSNLFYPQKN